MKVLITGADGLLGSALTFETRTRRMDVLPLTRDRLDITDAPSVREAIHDVRPTVIFNCAAFSNVDRAQAEPEEALAVNRDGARNLAEAAAEVDALLVHISTDYVFDGKKGEPYRPEDQPAPLSLYGLSKLAGELEVKESGAEYLILRTSWLFGAGSQGFVNFVRRSLPMAAGSVPDPLRIVNDETSRPTWVGHLAPALLDLVAKGARGCLHLANAGQCTRSGLAETIREITARGVGAAPLRQLTAITSKEFAAPARRPNYSVLDLSAAEAVLGRSLPGWREGLERFLGAGAPKGSDGPSLPAHPPRGP